MTDQVTVTVADTVTEDERNAIRVATIRERQRMIEKIASGGLRGYGTGEHGATVLKMTRDMFPDMGLTQEVWNALGRGYNPGVRDDRPQGWQATVDAWRASIDATVALITGQPALPDMPDVAPTVAPIDKPPPVVEPEDDEEAPERACECDGCSDQTCDGGCESCDDSGCEQCHDGCGHGCEVCNGDHDICDGCGYCSDCETHLDGDYPRPYETGPCDQGHCHSCEHHCPNH